MASELKIASAFVLTVAQSRRPSGTKVLMLLIQTRPDPRGVAAFWPSRWLAGGMRKPVT